jgi:hypothetical protein
MWREETRSPRWPNGALNDPLGVRIPAKAAHSRISARQIWTRAGLGGNVEGDQQPHPQLEARHAPQADLESWRLANILYERY